VTFTLLIRSYCHLCDDMREALRPIIAGHQVEVVEIDVDVEPALENRYGELVPVLFLGDAATGRELCHYHLDRVAVANALRAAAA